MGRTVVLNENQQPVATPSAEPLALDLDHNLNRSLAAALEADKKIKSKIKIKSKKPDMARRRYEALRLREQERLQRLRTLREFALEIMKDESSRLKEAGIEIAAAQIYELLADFDPLSLREKLDGDPAQFARIVGALARLSDGGLKYERYRAEVAERKAEIERDLAKAGPGGLTPEAVAEIERKVRLL
jgi:hypothetical protein